MGDRRKTGALGEEIAARYLEGLGYRVHERNFRCRLGEIDLIALDGDYLVFVEVKTRSPGALLSPSLSVTAKKRAKVRQLGEYYCIRHPELSLQPRFDVISIIAGRGREEVEHLVNAF